LGLTFLMDAFLSPFSIQGVLLIFLRLVSPFPPLFPNLYLLFCRGHLFRPPGRAQAKLLPPNRGNPLPVRCNVSFCGFCRFHALFLSSLLDDTIRRTKTPLCPYSLPFSCELLQLIFCKASQADPLPQKRSLSSSFSLFFCHIVSSEPRASGPPFPLACRVRFLMVCSLFSSQTGPAIFFSSTELFHAVLLSDPHPFPFLSFAKLGSFLGSGRQFPELKLLRCFRIPT